MPAQEDGDKKTESADDKTKSDAAAAAAEKQTTGKCSFNLLKKNLHNYD